MTTFALVHGGFHGAWCWDHLTPELEALGYGVVGPELPIEDTSAGNLEYARVVVDALDGIDDDVVVVGHSLGGLAIAHVAAFRSVSRLVYLAAAIPQPGEAWNDFRTRNPSFGPPNHSTVHVDDQGRILPPSGDDVVARFFHDCSPDVQAWAIALLRPHAPKPFSEACRLTEIPTIPADYIVCTEDRAVNPEFVRSLAKERLGVTAHDITSSHSPFLSHPAELASLLADLL
jgi:pimeloyl-ACP methyl ester carboxylesterase